MKSINITTAVLLAITAKGTESFSIFDLTKEIRKSVSGGEYLVDDDTYVAHNGGVKEVFEELLENGILDKFQEIPSNGNYRTFELINKPKQAPVKTMPFQSMKVAGAGFAAGQKIAVISSGSGGRSLMNDAQKVIAVSNDVQKAMHKYVSAQPRTMKQIQSRFKEYNFKCQELKAFFEGINLIDSSTSALPVSRVMTKRI